VRDPVELVPLDARGVQRVLATIPWLADLDAEERQALAEIDQAVRCARMVELLRMGENVGWLYVLLKGRAEISIRAVDGTTPVLREVVAGQTIGLDGVLSGEPTLNQVVTTETCSFVRWPVADLHGLLRGQSAISMKLRALVQEELGRELRAATVVMARLAAQ
jgi:CRP-like cAMP-binding protein